MSLEKEEIKQAKAKRLQDIEENQKKFEEKQLDLDKNFLFHKEEFNNEKQSTTKRFQEFNEKHIDLRSNYLIQKEQFENEKLAVLKRFEEIEKLHKEEALGYETRARTKKFQEIEEEIKNEEVALAQRLHEIEENQKKIEQKQLDLDKNFLFHIQEFTNEKQATAKILREIKKKQKDFASKLTTLMLGLIVLGIGILVMVNNQIEVIEPSELINTILNKDDLNNETLKQDEPNNVTLSLDESINTIPNKDDLNNETLKQDETNNETLSLDELINDNPSIDKKSILISGSADDQVKKELYKVLFQLDYDNLNDKEIEYDNRFKIIEQTDLNRIKFKIEDLCDRVQNGLKLIICLENLNPRPETLLNDIKILSECFESSNELKEKIFLIFTFSNRNQSKKLAELRSDILNFNAMFHFLNVVSDGEKHAFVENKVWILDDNEIGLKNMKEAINHYLNT
jgi:hypothetical protein